MNTLQIFLLVFEALFLGVAIFWRSYQVWRKTGLNAYRLSQEVYKQDTLHGFIAKLYRLTSLGSIVVISIYAFAEPFYRYLVPIPWLESPLLVGVGIIALIVAFIWMVIAQIQMGDSWRISIDSKHETSLVAHGLFKHSRNPIFLAVRIILAGFFFVLPNAATLAIWVMGDISVQVQVYLEEAHLQNLHGSDYERYCQKIRRWL